MWDVVAFDGDKMVMTMLVLYMPLWHAFTSNGIGAREVLDLGRTGGI